MLQKICFKMSQPKDGMLKHQLWWDQKFCSTKCFLVRFNSIPQHVILEAHTTLMCLCWCYLQSCRIPYVFLCSCILEPLQDLHFTPFICEPRRSVWSSLFFPGVDFFFLFEDPQAKYNTKNAGKYVAKKGAAVCHPSWLMPWGSARDFLWSVSTCPQWL